MHCVGVVKMLVQLGWVNSPSEMVKVGWIPVLGRGVDTSQMWESPLEKFFGFSQFR